MDTHMAICDWNPLDLQHFIDCAEYDELLDQFGEEYDDDLNSCGAVGWAGYSFMPATILKQCDPIAYRQGFLDFLDGYTHD